MTNTRKFSLTTADKYLILTGDIPCNGAGIDDYWPYPNKQAVNEAYKKHLQRTP